MPSFYSCVSSTSHEPTDQGEMIGCRDCRVEQFAASTDFFRPKHIYEPGDPKTPEISYFTYDPSDHSLSIASTGETVILDDPEDFIRHWIARGDLYWNTKHQSANWLTHQVGYGVAGSGTTKVGEFTSDLSGVLIAKALQPEAHPFPEAKQRSTGRRPGPSRGSARRLLGGGVGAVPKGQTSRRRPSSPAGAETRRWTTDENETASAKRRGRAALRAS